MLSLNMVNPVFFLSLSTWTWNSFLTLRGTRGIYLNHVVLPWCGCGLWCLWVVAHKIWTWPRACEFLK